MAPSPARFEVVAGNAVGTSIIVEDELLIGRHVDGPGRLGDDEEISRSHARLSVDESCFCAIEDLGSTNGTFVNGLRIAAPQTLAEGDTIELGGTTLVVRELPSLERVPATASPGPQPTVVPPARPPAPPEPEPAPPGTPAPLETEPGSPGPAVPPEPALAEPPAELLATEQILPEEAAVPPETAESLFADAAAPFSLSLRLTVDFDAREASLMLNEASEPFRFVFDAGEWRPVPVPEIEERPHP